MEVVYDIKLDGIVLLNGSGDLKVIQLYLGKIKSIVSCYLIFGICFGYQLIVFVFGGNIFKLLFGYRGVNYLVIDCEMKCVFMIS